ncbi:MAG: exosortase E/protease, VPEID-CTERM system [Rhodobacterales bacterium]|nr:exosortase E/protease, VPEID-CTERM system [Rhodobacterales bacterium]
MTASLTRTSPPPPHRRLLPVALVVLAELLAVLLVHQFLLQFECRATGAEAGCTALKGLVARGIVVAAVLPMIAWARPGLFGAILAEGQAAPGARRWLWLHALGLAIFFLPVILAQGRDLSPQFAQALVAWLGGAALAGLGALFWLAPPAAWARHARRDGLAVAAVVGLAALVPDLAQRILPIWNWEGPSLATFRLVEGLLHLTGLPIETDPAERVMGIDGFWIRIAQACSGLEGIALVAVFGALYAALFRDDLRLGRFVLVVMPLALAASWLLNAVRIAILVLIGVHVSPGLAVNGFHSYAGWLFFTLVALGMVAVMQAVPWLHRRPARPAPAGGLARDWLAARILPFVGFMLASLLAAALAPVPGLTFPLVTVALAAAVWPFRGLYARMDWRADPVALGAGLAVGVMWVALLPAAAGPDPLTAPLALLPPAGLALWAVLRVLGTVALAPLVEELFFRGYLQDRLSPAAPWGRWVGILAASAAFAALHGRWAEALAAGLVFALVRDRRGRLGDAVVAHMAANATVAAWAAATGQWSAI